MAGTSRSGQQHFVEATPTIEASSAYSAGDSIGAAVISLAGATAETGGLTAAEVREAAGWGTGNETHGGMIQSVILTDLGKQSAEIDVVFFDADPSQTTFTDNAALDVDDADLLNIVGVAAVTTWKDFSDNSVGQTLNLAIPFVLEDGGNTLYAALVSRGTPTYASTADLTLRVGVLAG